MNNKVVIGHGEVVVYNGVAYRVDHPVYATVDVELNESIKYNSDMKTDYLITGTHPAITNGVVITGELSNHAVIDTIAVLVNDCTDCDCKSKCERLNRAESPKYVITFDELGHVRSVYYGSELVDPSDFVDVKRSMVNLKADGHAVVQVVLHSDENCDVDGTECGKIYSAVRYKAVNDDLFERVDERCFDGGCGQKKAKRKPSF